jgi:hypothetical protein
VVDALLILAEFPAGDSGNPLAKNTGEEGVGGSAREPVCAISVHFAVSV